MNLNFPQELDKKDQDLMMLAEKAKRISEESKSSIQNKIRLILENHEKLLQQKSIMYQKKQSQIKIIENARQKDINQLQELQEQNLKLHNVLQIYDDLYTFQKEEFMIQGNLGPIEELQQLQQQALLYSKSVKQTLQGIVQKNSSIDEQVRLLSQITGVTIIIKKQTKTLHIQINEDLKILLHYEEGEHTMKIRDISPKIKNHEKIIDLFSINGDLFELICLIKFQLDPQSSL